MNKTNAAVNLKELGDAFQNAHHAVSKLGEAFSDPEFIDAEMELEIDTADEWDAIKPARTAIGHHRPKPVKSKCPYCGGKFTISLDKHLGMVPACADQDLAQ